MRNKEPYAGIAFDVYALKHKQMRESTGQA